MSKYQKTKYPGVRYVEHQTRKHGVQFDKYFSIYFKIDGKQIEEACGWASEGMTAAKAAAIRAELKENHRRGEGCSTLREKRTVQTKKKEADTARQEEEKRDCLTFGEVFSGPYLSLAQDTKKKASWSKETWLFRTFLDPVIGKTPLKDVSPFQLEKIKKNMNAAGMAPKTVMYALATIRQVFNFARRNDLFSGDHPVSKVSKPKFDNRRQRFLSQAEAARLLEALALKSQQVYEMALLSLHCGLRLGECFNLEWADVNLESGILTLLDTKNARTRPAIMTKIVKEMLSAKTPGAPHDRVFSSAKGRPVEQISASFARTVKALGFNEGVMDTRHKVVFHTLRHTYASWLVQCGTDLFTVQKLLGHESISMTQRYAHLSPDTLQSAVKNLEASFDSSSPAQAANAASFDKM